MKRKLFFIVALLILCNKLFAQGTASLKIINATDCLYQFSVYAQSTVMGATGCTDIMMVIYVPAMTTIAWATPYALETAMGGWTYFPSGFSGTVEGNDGMSCLGPNSWTTCYPSDWVWVYADVDFHCSDPCAVAGTIGIGCYATGLNIGPYSPCTYYATWQPGSTGPLVNVTIYVGP